MQNLPPIQGPIDPDHWREQINDLACRSACDLLATLGPEKSIELAFATLQAYYTLIFTIPIPFLEHDGTRPARLATLTDIIESVGLKLDTTIHTRRKD